LRLHGAGTLEVMQTIQRVTAQIFPVTADRWIAVVGAPDEPFVTESCSAAGVASQIRRSIEDLHGWVPEIELIDERGRPWTPGQAPLQMSRMKVPDPEVRRSLLQRVQRLFAWR
jgi:hypothetical protein